jgi:hypothetical protein
MFLGANDTRTLAQVVHAQNPPVRHGGGGGGGGSGGDRGYHKAVAAVEGTTGARLSLRTPASEGQLCESHLDGTMSTPSCDAAVKQHGRTLPHKTSPVRSCEAIAFFRPSQCMTLV